MVEVDVGDDDAGEIRRAEPERRQRVEEDRDRGLAARLDQDRAWALQ